MITVPCTISSHFSWFLAWYRPAAGLSTPRVAEGDGIRMLNSRSTPIRQRVVNYGVDTLLSEVRKRSGKNREKGEDWIGEDRGGVVEERKGAVSKCNQSPKSALKRC